MKFKTKILIIPALAVAFLLLNFTGTTWLGVMATNLLDRVEQGYGPALEQSQQLEGLLAEAQRTLQDAVAAEDAELLLRADATKDQFLSHLAAAKNNPVVDPQRIAQLERDFSSYIKHARATCARMIAKDAKVGPDLEIMTAQYNALKESLRKDTERAREQRAQAIDEVRRNQRIAQWANAGFLLACLAALVTLSLWVISGALGPLGRLTAAASRIERDGDLTQEISVESADEFGQLATAFAKMVLQLREVHLAIEDSVQKLAAAAAEIYAASQEQEAASQTQATGAEEVNRTMMSLLESATHIADSASGVFTNAERSKETSASTAGKISELSSQTNRVVEILEVIREIADRTDLLALNASLEGTRAGDAGRGFSLVANEMRRLSERVTASVADVKGLVADIRASGAATVMVTDEARKLAEGTASSAKQITLVTQQQKTATELVSRSMSDVLGVLVQSVAANKETKRAAEELKGQAERLTGLVRRFKVEARKA